METIGCSALRLYSLNPFGAIQQKCSVFMAFLGFSV